jgi:hypothetical protein
MKRARKQTPRGLYRVRRTVLPIGTQTLTALFTPADSANYVDLLGRRPRGRGVPRDGLAPDLELGDGDEATDAVA